MKKNNSLEQIQADYHLFINIQMEKYLKSVGRKEFKSDKEAQSVIKNIIDTYNRKIANEHFRLDISTDKEKEAWFNSVEIG